ncbi:hypothetical protein G3I40_40865 [Streptomyces sp. SID14478]|uniref:hypothetical protein n=1 Tax=Streptomyces sp. SID14478 TaxID=2706073 RepID=UPI0013DECE10|nr:hypothetical protein [Streptomyces sp. SID14478]NEB81519.1 hypothetical protein [Streptomyces sp. SID14478]
MSAVVPVECARCGNQVLCEKYSPAHLQVQWTSESALACPRVADSNGPPGQVWSCPELRHSVRRAVEGGLLKVTQRESGEG